jgi:hypothetical protein
MNEQPVWSVGLVVNDAELRHLSENSVAMYIMEATEGHYLRFSSPPEESSDFENLRMEVAASSAAVAEDRALGIVYRARKTAGLPDRVVPVAWVSPQGQMEGGENFLDQAENLLEGENFSLAIVAAEIHLDAQVKTMIELAVKGMAPDFEEVLLQHPNNLRIHHFAGRKMVERFLGLSLTHLPEWEEYRAHLSRRNEAAHSGRRFEEEEAKQSIAVVRKTWLRIADAFRAAEQHFLSPVNS